MKSLSILCQKGGVGKTTIVVNIAKIYSNNGSSTSVCAEYSATQIIAKRYGT